MKIGRKSGILISGIVAIIIFFILIFVQQNLIAPNGSTEVYVTAKRIDKGTVLNEENLNLLFKRIDVNNDAIIEGAIYSEDELLVLKDKIVSRDMLKGEGLSNERVVDKDSMYENTDNIIEVSLNSGDISEIVGGILREGDSINISSIDPVTKESARILENIYVDKALSTDGSKINREDTMAAARINLLLLNKEDEAKLNKAIELGGIKVSKVR